MSFSAEVELTLLNWSDEVRLLFIALNRVYRAQLEQGMKLSTKKRLALKRPPETFPVELETFVFAFWNVSHFSVPIISSSFAGQKNSVRRTEAEAEIETEAAKNIGTGVEAKQSRGKKA